MICRRLMLIPVQWGIVSGPISIGRDRRQLRHNFAVLFDVPSESKGDLTGSKPNFRFAPDSGPKSDMVGGPFRAKSGHVATETSVQ